jgi:hypothetical protein
MAKRFMRGDVSMLRRQSASAVGAGGLIRTDDDDITAQKSIRVCCVRPGERPSEVRLVPGMSSFGMSGRSSKGRNCPGKSRFWRYGAACSLVMFTVSCAAA